MGGPAEIHHAIQQQEPGTFVILLGIEDQLAVRAFRSSAGIGGLYVDWAAGLLRPGCQVESVQALMVVAAAILAGRDHEDGSVGACLGVDHGRRRHANVRRHLAAAPVIAEDFSGAQRRNMPESCARVGVKGVSGVILRDDIQNVMSGAANGHSANIKRLGIHLAIRRIKANLAEGGGGDIRRRQDGFLGILPFAGVVIVIGQHLHAAAGCARRPGGTRGTGGPCCPGGAGSARGTRRPSCTSRPCCPGGTCRIIAGAAAVTSYDADDTQHEQTGDSPKTSLKTWTHSSLLCET